jgi:putative endonuclease
MDFMNHVYIMTTRKNTALYVGVTSDLARRIWEHKEGLVNSHSKKYSINKLVYTEEFEDIREAIHREKCIKRWKRDWKIELIEKVNPRWEELSIL